MQLYHCVAVLLAICAPATICLTNSTPSIQGAQVVPNHEPSARFSGSQTVGQYKLPKLFDFETYKRQFSKSYGSKIEEMARKNWFFGRAFRAFISSIRFKQRLDDSFKSLNPLSDRSISELSQMANQLLTNYVRPGANHGEPTSSSGGAMNKQIVDGSDDEQSVGSTGTGTGTGGSESDEQDEQFELIEIGGESSHQSDSMQLAAASSRPALIETAELERKLIKLATLSQSLRRSNDADFTPKNEHERRVLELLTNELEFQVLASGKLKRTRRHLVTNETFEEPAIISERKLAPGRLINAGNSLLISRRLAKRINLQPNSNNPLYQEPDWSEAYLSQFSFGLRSENLQQLNWIQIGETSPKGRGSAILKTLSSLGSFGKGGRSFLGQLGQYFKPTKRDKQLKSIKERPDEVFLDHRESDCLFLARDQGLECGSCYAFAMVALVEWLHCRQTGELVPFSEQYMIDCGEPVNHAGCKGGEIMELGNFIQNFGLQLRHNYRYDGHQNQCPYNDNTDPKTMGYIRMDLMQGNQIPLARFEEFIKYGPIIVGLAVGSEFYEYGGGVFASCHNAKEGHAVLIIGHGREDNKDYWLIRNSYGLNWGEKGHMKLWKRARACFKIREGFVYGKLEEKSIGEPLVKVQLNAHYDKSQFMANRRQAIAKQRRID